MCCADVMVPALLSAGTRDGQPVGYRVPDRLGPALHGGLGEDAVHVGLDRRLAEDEPFADLAVRQALADEREHLDFPRGEVVGEPGERAGRLGRDAVAERADQACLYHRVQPRLAAVDRSDGGLDLLGARVLGEVAGRTRAKRGEDRFVIGVRGEHDDARRAAPGDLPGGLHAVHLRHAQVHEDDVGGELVDQRDGRRPVRRGADDLDALAEPDEHGQAIADGPLVIGDDHPHGHGVGHAGALTTTDHPGPDGPAVNSPPSRLIRSRTPARPQPLPSAASALCSPPSSVTTSRTPAASKESSTRVLAPAACRATFVSASPVTRYRARPRSGGTGRGVPWTVYATARPKSLRKCSTSAGSWSTPSRLSRRSAPTASRAPARPSLARTAASSMAARSSAGASALPASLRITSSWIASPDSDWARTSCRSRAMLARSCAAAARAWSSRASSSCARSSSVRSWLSR